MRRAAVEDAEILHGILVQAGSEGTIAPAQPALDDIATFLQTDSAGAFIVSRDGDCGAALFNRQGDVFWLFRLAVVDAARGRGAGRALVSAVEAAARGVGATAVFVQVAKDSQARSFFETLGYEIDNEEPDVVAGTPVTMVDLVKLV